MDWQDTGVVLTTRRHGESSAILEVFTETHGRHAGVVRGATSRKVAPALQPGTQVAVVWRARLESHLGAFTVEPIRSRAAAVMSGRQELAALNAVTALLTFALPERQAHPRLYAQSITLLDMIGEAEVWPLAYLHWELALLDELGFGLDLTSCAVTGGNDRLAYVSPRTGRAVSASAAGEWADRLLPLPACLLSVETADLSGVAEALRTTGHFLNTRLAPALGDRPLPAARQRFADLFGRRA
ncbi:MAG: DNA repair protein RecO [Rhodobacter sp.]|jgi:DNA repair protein RecO (recombination protein O)|nr:DNA repair protein RecO [Rhodobacter sp.]